MILIILQSILVYGFMMWVMTYCGKIAYNNQYPHGIGDIDMLADKKTSFRTILLKNYFLVPILIFCFFAAVRYSVGVDCESYKKIFYEIGYFGSSSTVENIEIGFVWLSKFVFDLTGLHYLLLFILAFLQIFFYYYGLRNDRYCVAFFGLAVFLTGHYWSLMNGVRQNIVACAFVAMLPLILQKKWVYFALAVFVASLMHRSAFILLFIGLLVYYLPNKVLNVKLQLIIFVVCYLLMNRFEDVLFSLSEYAAYIGYTEHSITAYTSLENTVYTFGLRMWLLYLSYTIAIIYSDKMNKLYNSRFFTICYNLFFIGACLQLVFYNNFTITRLLYYLVCFAPIVISATLFYFWRNKKQNMFILMLLILLMRTLYELYAEASKSHIETYLYKFDF